MRAKRHEATIEARRKAVAANLIGGLNYRDMAEVLDCSIGTISKDVKVILQRLKEDQVTAARDCIAIEVRRLDKLLNTLWARALSGDLKTIETAMKVMEQRTKLLGLEGKGGLVGDEAKKQLVVPTVEEDKGRVDGER